MCKQKTVLKPSNFILRAVLIHFQDSFLPAYADFIFIYSKIVKKNENKGSVDSCMQEYAIATFCTCLLLLANDIAYTFPRYTCTRKIVVIGN